MRTCWICTGKGNGLCATHYQEAQYRAATYNISAAEAAFQIRETEVEAAEEGFTSLGEN